MKHIKNWKLYQDKVSLSEALEVLNYENDKYILNEAESFFASKSC